MIKNDQFTDILSEFINIGSGKAADALNQLFGTHIKMYQPSIKLDIHPGLLKHYTPDETKNYYVVLMKFTGGMSGTASLTFDREESHLLLSKVQAEPELSNNLNFRQSVLTETGNIIINAIIGSMSNMIKSEVQYSVPEFYELNTNSQNIPERAACTLRALTTFSIEEFNVSTNILLLFNSSDFIDNYKLPGDTKET